MYFLIQELIKFESLTGDVGCKTTKVSISGCLKIKSFKTSIVVAVSEAKYSGLSSTFAPYSKAHFFIVKSSVET